MTAKSLTAKQEAFCHAILSGMSQADAYRKAYSAAKMKDATIHKRASELMANGEVTGRIAALRQSVVEKLQYGLEEAMAEAAEAFKVAKYKEQGGAMVAAVQLRAKLNGLLIDKREDVTDPLKKAMANMTPEKAEQMLNALDEIDRIKDKAKNAP